jgi:nicotinamide mononucleotide adenylyltransferase
VYESGLFNRDELEGVKIRKMMRSGDEKWKSRVPKEVLGQIDMSAI